MKKLLLDELNERSPYVPHYWRVGTGKSAMCRTLTPREYWKKAYRVARQPDSFLASPMVLDFPVHYLLYAQKCLNWRL